jgi:hypothetical protein
MATTWGDIATVTPNIRLVVAEVPNVSRLPENAAAIKRPNN